MNSCKCCRVLCSPVVVALIPYTCFVILYKTSTMRGNQDLMCHVGFQQLYMQQTVQGGESPKETVHRLIEAHKGKLDKITVLGHSLGAGERGKTSSSERPFLCDSTYSSARFWLLFCNPF